MEGVAFNNDPVKAWTTINKFVEDQTKGEISDFMNRLLRVPEFYQENYDANIRGLLLFKFPLEPSHYPSDGMPQN